jgi:hypothetical protein
MAAPVALSVGFTLLRVLDGDCGGTVLCESERMSHMQGKIAHKMVVCHHQTLEDFGNVQTYPERHLLASFHGPVEA